MRSQSLITDHAMALAQAILDIVAPCLREEEHREAFGMFFDAAKEVLLRYEEKAQRMYRRVKPSAN
jgi:dsDNA-binding SOS-regulon protein